MISFRGARASTDGTFTRVFGILTTKVLAFFFLVDELPFSFVFLPTSLAFPLSESSEAIRLLRGRAILWKVKPCAKLNNCMEHTQSIRESSEKNERGQVSLQQPVLCHDLYSRFVCSLQVVLNDCNL